MIAGIRFTKVGKIYHFDLANNQDVRIGDALVVDTARGIQLGWIAELLENYEAKEGEEIKPVLRIATAQDLVQRQDWKSREEAINEFCRAKIRDLRLSGVKIVDSEFSLDGNRLVILYNIENDEKIDLKVIRQEVQRTYSGTQIELRQIGPRDMAKCMGGMGACGLENRCCSSFLCDFSSISIRMAKEQGISLTPGEITGICGRLRCCLSYEYETYIEARMGLPKRKKMVKTPDGIGKVIDVAPLSKMIYVSLPEIGMRSYHTDDLEVLDTPEPNQKQNQRPAKTEEESIEKE